MTAYHGTTVMGLSELRPFAKAGSNLDYPCIYLSAYKPLAALYIWNREYMWFNYGFMPDETLVYTESFPDALKEFYGGLSGCIYACEGDFEFDANAKIRHAVISRSSIPVFEADFVGDALERILEYEAQELLKINRYESLTEVQRESERKMVLSAIKRHKLLNGIHPMSAFVQGKFPEIWDEAKNIGAIQ